ncbi:hypothetical protein AQUSIP_12830 [Aquicella siphonis]|uniref:Uncharacterized protein n=1 Tax=Aquicella siphonis TaxID=254247 RepID=A0A5E4PHV1_9COXI|nr:baseplate J/gp47 family protein [Aquicella siphonis]VVC75982.1 hypothetical protein AQUSIP_12830 [Aquicella siphonis]
MPLQTQDFTTLVRNQIAAIQASSTDLLDFTTGSVLLALIEANTAGVALWLQGLASYDLSLARAATSNGTDLDSWMADFGFVREPATYATGTVTFARTDASIQTLIAVGAQVQTSNAVAVFSVTADTTDPNYNASLNGYVLNAGITSITVPVQATVAGTSGNVGANTITVAISPIAYVDTVTNAASFTNGMNAENDADFRARFVLYLASLSKATYSAIAYAIETVTGVTSYSITENEDYSGTTKYGYFYVVVDDGTGTPSGGFISTVNDAVDAVRGLTITFGVFAPIVVTVDAAMTVTAATGYDHGAVAALVETAIEDYLNNLDLGEPVYYTRIMQIAYDASPGVLNVSGYTLDGGTSDIAITAKQIAKAGTVTIS